ncbi:MAG: 4-(cytidine 5'-diphospho)-2-C-methyl-D-erythritol kinase [Clostridia bacterium]|nr:4-(cytidine 5'-diphospho)-2-C-methyl-D-erythritol kinase [Clostridia bacterium]
MESIRLKARAKINLGLDVLRKREDGYHDVRMVMQTIGIYDRLIITRIPEEDIRIKSNLFFLPVNENNLIYKAAKLLKDSFGFAGGVEIDLNKFIPVSAGLAGGSTDAASTLFGLNRLFDLGLSTKDLMELGVSIGADVPYCVMRGTALAEGIGEKLTALPPLPRCWILIAKPPINVSTKLVYESLDMNGVDRHPDIDGLIDAIKRQDINGVCSLMGNVLENVTVPLYPVIESIKNDMMDNGAINAMMSGSGPTVFGIFPDEETTLKCQAFLKNKGEARQVYITESFN